MEKEKQQEIAVVPGGAAEIMDVQLNEMVFNPERFAMMNQLAEVMASGVCTVPRHLAGNRGDCFAIVMQSMMWGMNPFAVAQKTHLINGTLGYEAQLVNAVVEKHITGVFDYEWFGPWEKVVGKYQWKDGKNGKYQAPGWQPADEIGCGIRVSATLKGETEPRVLELLLVQATVRNSTLWASDPRQQLAYLAVKRWTRLYKPGAILGVYSDDELQSEPVNVTPPEAKPSRSTASRRLKDKLGIRKAEEAPVDAEVVEESPAFSEKLRAEIESRRVPITVEDVENFLRHKKVLTGSVRLDELDKYPEDWRKYVTESMPALVDAVAEWAVHPAEDGNLI